MSDIIQADIFFFISAVSTVIVAILVVIALIYLIGILRNVRHLSERARIEGDFLMDEVRIMSERLEENRFLPAIFYFIRRIFRRYF